MSFRLVGRAITLPFRQVQQFVQRATAWATATEIWVKNTIRFLLESGVRIVHVFIRSLFWLKLFSLAKLAASRALCALIRGPRVTSVCDDYDKVLLFDDRWTEGRREQPVRCSTEAA